MVEVPGALGDASEMFESSVDASAGPTATPASKYARILSRFGLTSITDSDMLDFASCDLRV